MLSIPGIFAKTSQIGQFVELHKFQGQITKLESTVNENSGQLWRNWCGFLFVSKRLNGMWDQRALKWDSERGEGLYCPLHLWKLIPHIDGPLPSWGRQILFIIHLTVTKHLLGVRWGKQRWVRHGSCPHLAHKPAGKWIINCHTKPYNNRDKCWDGTTGDSIALCLRVNHDPGSSSSHLPCGTDQVQVTLPRHRRGLTSTSHSRPGYQVSGWIAAPHPFHPRLTHYLWSPPPWPQPPLALRYQPARFQSLVVLGRKMTTISEIWTR